MRADKNPWLEALANRVAEGEEIDWEAEELNASGADDQRALQGLKILAEMAAHTVSQEETIGPYVLRKKLGEGGMGEVWEAEQTDPIRRTVALKLIKLGMDTSSFVTRFEAELQALALMDHPAIARVYDAGASEHGRPYFVMELVRGVPITEHCDRYKLTTHERLELFRQVCDGVQHAHQKAIIHRDIKPGNVLVTIQDGKPVPKIIDFGVAKAIDRPLTERTLLTEAWQIIGTPAYMSPEQAQSSSKDLDTRTDVYSLGVLLYELLAGAPPFDPQELRAAALDEMLRILREEIPLKPSTRVSMAGQGSEVSAVNRKTETTTLTRQLQGDLDWITMKALEKDRSRRYGSPADLAADLGRYLVNEPVTAGPPSAWYRTRKFVRRHRLGVGLAIIAILLLAGVAVRERVNATRIAGERDRANLEAATAERTAEYMIRLIQSSRPHNSLGREITVRELLEKGSKTIESDLKDEPKLQGRLTYEMALAFKTLGYYDRAERLALRSVEIRNTVLGVEHPETLQSRQLRAAIIHNQGNYELAARIHREVLDAKLRVLGPDHENTHWSRNTLAMAYWKLDRIPEAEAMFRDVRAGWSRTLGPDAGKTWAAQQNVGRMCFLQGKYDEAEILLLEVLEAMRRVRGPEHPWTIGALNELARMYQHAGRYKEADERNVEVIEIGTRVIGEEHVIMQQVFRRTAKVLSALGREKEAQQMEAKAKASETEK